MNLRLKYKAVTKICIVYLCVWSQQNEGSFLLNQLYSQKLRSSLWCVDYLGFSDYTLNGLGK